ncbi:MAG TPA: hypothetical protein VF794_00405 [Archangium sp.]|jgi:hypothetical protein|uniref:hypothetical protein n=1 Tax=Archangium sp. TaxID=1872627 RepID=UPI002EDBB583
MSKISSSPSIAPGAGCYRPDAPTPKLPGELKPLPTPTFPPGLPPGGLKELINQKRSAELSNSQANQLEQIKRGVENGTISPQEATRLLEQQAKIADTLKAAQADGFISAQERAAIKRQQFVAGFSVSKASNSFELGSLLSRDRAATQAQAAQIGSLAQGIRSGDLSSPEASSLLKEQANIARTMANAQSDGRVSISEKMHLSILQESAGRDIRIEKGDLEKAPHAVKRFSIDF